MTTQTHIKTNFIKAGTNITEINKSCMVTTIKKIQVYKYIIIVTPIVTLYVSFNETVKRAMRFVTFVCILGQILLSQHAARSVCECIEDVTEGEIIVAGDEIMFDGVAEIEGNVPMSGKIAFEGPVRAAGTVTIIGTSRPVFPAFGLSPTIAPSMMFPTYYYPYYSFPNAYYAAPDSDEALGYGNIKANGEEIHVVGETSIEGNVPITGNVCFGGGVPAFGKVKILARF